MLRANYTAFMNNLQNLLWLPDLLSFAVSESMNSHRASDRQACHLIEGLWDDEEPCSMADELFSGGAFCQEA